jgi:hypothetical protein
MRNPLWFSVLLFLLGGCAQTRIIPFENESGFFGYRKEDGDMVLPARYLDAKEFSGCCAFAGDEFGWVVIDKKGKKLFRPFVVDQEPDGFREGLARFTLEGKVGYYDKRYRTRIPARFVYAGPFHQGYARFCEECHRTHTGTADSMSRGKWGFIDAKGRVVVKPEFDFAYTPRKDSLVVLMGERTLSLPVQGGSAGTAAGL